MKILPWVIFVLVIALAWMILGRSSGYDDPVAPTQPVVPPPPMAYPNGPGRRRHRRRHRRRQDKRDNLRKVCIDL